MISLKTILLASLIISHGAILYGCKEVSQNPPTEIASSPRTPAPPEVSAKKYGAAIRFSHSYDGSSDVDQAEDIELTFQPTQTVDSLVIDLSSSDNILLGGDRSIERTVSGTSAVTIPVTIVATSEGKFYLNILAQTEHNGRRLGRAFAVAINVGEIPTAQKTTANKQDNVHVMPAREEIR